MDNHIKLIKSFKFDYVNEDRNFLYFRKRLHPHFISVLFTLGIVYITDPKRYRVYSIPKNSLDNKNNLSILKFGIIKYKPSVVIIIKKIFGCNNQEAHDMINKGEIILNNNLDYLFIRYQFVWMGIELL